MNKFVLVILLLAVSVSVALAQETGGVKGKVRTTKGEGIAGVSVTARQNSEDVKSATSDNKGNFELEGLKAGLYNIVFSKNGYSSGLMYNVEVKQKKTNNLGDRLVLTIDQGTQVIIKGTVFDQDGRSVAGAKVEIEKILSDGSTKKIGSGFTSYGGAPTARGEFTFKFSEGAAKFRVTASAGGASASKEVEVSNAAIYRLAIILDMRSEI
jgi:hypothetical protein